MGIIVCSIAGLSAAFRTPQFLWPTRSQDKPSKKPQSRESLQPQPKARKQQSNGEGVKPGGYPAAENEPLIAPTQPIPLNHSARAPHNASFRSFNSSPPAGPLQPAATSQDAGPFREIKPVSAEPVIAIPQPNRPPPRPADTAIPSQSHPTPAGDDHKDEQMKDYATHAITGTTSSQDPPVQHNSSPSSDSPEVPLPGRDNNVHLPTGQSPAPQGSPARMHELPGAGSLTDQVTDDPSAIDSDITPQPYQLIHDH